MAYLNDLVLDNGLAYLTANVEALHICNAEPATYAEATSTFTIGNKSGPTVGSPENGASSGRRVVVSAISDGEATATDDATHWALVDVGGTALLAAGPLAAPQAITDGNVLSIAAFSITIPDPA